MAGMGSGNLEQLGRMDQHTSHNAPYSLGKTLSTISHSQAKGAHFSGMHIPLG